MTDEEEEELGLSSMYNISFESGSTACVALANKVHYNLQYQVVAGLGLNMSQRFGRHVTARRKFIIPKVMRYVSKFFARLR